MNNVTLLVVAAGNLTVNNRTIATYSKPGTERHLQAFVEGPILEVFNTPAGHKRTLAIARAWDRLVHIQRECTDDLQWSITSSMALAKLLGSQPREVCFAASREVTHAAP